jgi:hypothetical protein
MRGVYLLLPLLIWAQLSGCAKEEPDLALALEQEVGRIAAENELWPGYHPMETPLAVFDGKSTYLFRHPAPPQEFHELQGIYVFEGRHPAVVANCAADIGGVTTATVMLQPPLTDRTVRGMAALVLHEAFHVFQHTTGRTWGANEASLFMYPVEDTDLLSLRRLETEALRRAFAAKEEGEITGWARTALGLRQQRFNRMDPVFPAYERGIEAMEGTATYVEYKAAGWDHPDFPAQGFDPEDVRSRAYITGLAFALLLDGFDPGWRDGFGADNTQELDTKLADALSKVHESLRCAFSAYEVTEVTRRACQDEEALLARRAELRQEFESAPGWQIVVEADSANPLWPQGFDPLNIRRVDGGLLHTRFLGLANGMGRLDVMGDTILTEGLGPHPMFSGIIRAVLTGFETEPELTAEGERVVISLPRLSMDFRGAVVETTGKQVYLRLGPGND